jgi:hypothetical protein
VRPNLGAKRIDINFAPQMEDTRRYGPVPGGKMRHFIAFCAEKFAKINQERVKMNAFLPPELQYAGLHVDVKPLPKHAIWHSPRTFVFNDSTTSLMFIQSFPELLDEPAKDAMVEVLKLMRERKVDEAEKELDQLASVLSDLPVETQMRILYDKACLFSMRAETQPQGSSGREEALDRAVNYLVEWFDKGRSGAFDATGRTMDSEFYRMLSDLDLSLVLAEKREALRKAMPNAHWPTPGGRGGGGCVPFGTVIDTPSGDCRVEFLRPGDEVVSVRFGNTTERVKAKIAAIATTRSPYCIQLRRNCLVTPAQPVRTANGWIEAAGLKRGDQVMDGHGELVVVEHLSVIEGYFEVFDLSIEEPWHSFVANGLVCHNKEQEWGFRPPV